MSFGSAGSPSSADGYHLYQQQHQQQQQEQLDMSSSSPSSVYFTNVYVKNLPEEITDAELRRIFMPFGQITSCAVAVDDAGVSRCFGFVNFETHEAAMGAVNAMHGTEVRGNEW